MSFDDNQPCQIIANILSRNPLGVIPNKNITLVYGSKVDRWAISVEERHLHEGYMVNWSNFAGAPATVGDVIFLLDLEGPFIHDISENDFETLKRHFSNWKDSRMLWVTPSILVGHDDPCYGLAMGFARTMRKELTLNLATVEIDRFDANAAEALVRVLRKFESTDFGCLSPDFEFALHKSSVQIPRFIWQPLPKQLTLASRNDLPRKLFMRDCGVLNSMEWGPVKLGALGENEVEVEVRYVGLNFRVIAPLIQHVIVLYIALTPESIGHNGGNGTVWPYRGIGPQGQRFNQACWFRGEGHANRREYCFYGHRTLPNTPSYSCE